jgi:hypothetical protein
MGLQFFHRFFQTENSRVVLKLGVGVLLGLVAPMVVAQDVALNVTYVCNGERVYVESCNIRDLSNTSTCMVAHPDRPQHNGFMAYTTETRGTLKKLFPTCKQPSAEEVARSEAFKKKQAEIYAASVARASEQGSSGAGQGSVAGVSAGQIAPPKNAEEREIRRCVSSGRLPATCTGNQLLGAFGKMLGSVAPALDTTHPAPGPEMAGVYSGAGNWRLDFIDGGVLVNCADLSPDQHSYKLDFRSDRTLLTVDTTPRPLVLTLRGDGTMVGPGPFVLNGVVATGVAKEGDPNASSGLTDQYGMSLSNSQAASRAEVYKNGQAYYGSKDGSGPVHATFAHKQVTCPALNLSAKEGAVGVQTMQTNLLKSMFSDGDTGAPTPAGIRMHGIFAAETGLSVEFFPESVIMGCGPDVARAYPYTVEAGASGATIKINAPDKPLVLAFRANGGLEPSSAGAYLVHGRITTGQDDDGNFTFAPMEQSCDLAALTPSRTIPASGGVVSGGGGVAGAASRVAMATPGAPTGTAVLLLVSGLPVQAGAANALAGHPYILLRDNVATVMAQAGVTVPAGMSPYTYLGMACGQHTPECPKIIAAVQADTASAARADAAGKGTMPGVPAGTYYLKISTRYNSQALVWDEAVELKAGENSMALDLRNGRVVH